MFLEINGSLYNVINIDKIEKSSYYDDGVEIFQLLYYANKNKGILKQDFKSKADRDKKYEELSGKSKRLFG